MSRPLRPFLPAFCAVFSLGFGACVGTLYDRTYSYKKNHFKAPVAKKEVSAEAILGAVEAPAAPGAPGGLPALEGAVPPPPAGAIPGLPAADPAAPPAVPPPAT